MHATWLCGTFASLTSSEAAPRLAEPAPWVEVGVGGRDRGRVRVKG